MISAGILGLPFFRENWPPARALIQTEWAPPQLFDPDNPPSAHLSCARVVEVAIVNVSASRWGAREDPFEFFSSKTPSPRELDRGEDGLLKRQFFYSLVITHS